MAGCTFDPGGSQPADLDPNTPDSARSAPADDAASPDATPDCVDSDGDGAWLSLTGADCGPVIDCDDSDPRVHPNQTEHFATARNIGGYDFDCDGVETRANTEQGGQCGFEWFECKGTGWMVTVPDCGATGTYHECAAGFLSCNEAQSVVADQLCR
jgi:hypothetical protein